ncbi:MAG TPA: arylsulfatase [Blastocatellia bacterium]|nr:arylsulfatase [Blastocatellia bacterium]
MMRKMTATRITLKLSVVALAISSMFLVGHALSQAGSQQPDPQRPTIGRSYKDSKPAWELPPQAPKGAPNIIYLVLDDVGYAQLGCYGSEIQTPNIDRLAAGGLRYTNFHTTSLCSPSRACLLTGDNHHSNHLGVITEAATGFPGYDGRMPRSQGTIAEILRQSGYSTFYIGKWHQAPPDETSDAGPFDHWPLGMGFERFYGFLGGETNQWFPDLVYDNHRVERPNRPGYHLTEDLTDRAIQFIAEQKQVTPDKPFFMNLAYGAGHAPHHVAKKYIQMYKGKFDKGWDKVREETLARQKAMGIVPPNTQLAPRNSDVKAWSDLTDAQRRLYARMEEVFAGFLTHCDENIGRLLDFLEARSLLENTLLVVVSDNGASQEGRETGTFNESLYFNQIPEDVEMDMRLIDELGGPMTYPHYPLGWAMAGNTPFKRYKQETHAGGITDPLILHWPKTIRDKGGIRTQYHHMIDVTPTVLDLLGIKQPRVLNGVDQRSMDGVSMAYTIGDAKTPSRRESQYYEMLGHRSIYYKGWVAVTRHTRGEDFDKDPWELYNVSEDFSESNDIAAQNPGKLREMIERWWSEAGRYNVLPLDDRGVIRALEQPGLNRPATVVTYYPGMSPVPRTNMLNFRNRSYSITAEVEMPASGGEGVLLSLGGRFGGFSFYVQKNRLGYAYNWVGLERYSVTSTEAVPEGSAKLRVEFTNSPGGGTAALFINDRRVGEGRIARLVPITFGLSEGLTIGRDPATPVTESYQSPFEFNGKIKKVVMELKEDPKQASAK